VSWIPGRERAAALLVPHLVPGAVLVTIGAGDVFELARRLVADGEPG